MAGGRARWPVVAAVVAVVIVLVGLGLVVRDRLAASDGPDSAFVAPEAEWRTITPEDQSFRAVLPAAPEVDAIDADLGAGTTTVNRYRVTEGPDTITILVADLPEAPTLAAVADATAALDGGSASAPVERSITGFPAADWTVNHPDGSRSVTRAVLSGARLFVDRKSVV